MPKAKPTPKPEIAPMVSIAEFHALRDRVNQLESEKDRLVQEIHILKKIPADLTTQQSILNRHTERLDSMTASVGSVTQRLEALPAPKPKKRFVII
jgi:division protein CdvB (Snf7/Vps24/ESCRT-III family)